jgi:ankyrin repeat protein
MQQWQAIFDRPIKRKDAKFRDADGLYSLHWAAAGGAPTPVLQSLIDAYPSAIRKTDNEGSLPLHFAAHYSAGLGTVELLLRSYPEAVRAQDKYGRTPTYHAAEKSAKLEVLKLLVNEDPGTVTTPCYVVSNKSTTRSFTTRFDKKDLSSMTRSQAILTPLYLVWNDVVFDHNARTRHTGKKWEKAVWMLQQAYQHHTSRKNDSVLLACISMDIFLPEQVISLIVKAYPDLLRVPDSIHGNLPLATAAIACNSTPKSLAYRRQVILETLLDAYTPAVAQRNQHGRSVLWEAGATGRISWKILERILKHAPDALDWQDRETHLPLALYTAASSVSAIDPLSHHSSCVLEQDHPVDSTIRDFLDPFHLLTDKQFDLLLKEHEKEHKPDVPVHETTADHHHLNVIYEFLKANPSQIIVRS